MKTPEEILEEIFYRPETQDWHKPVLKAMQEYAQQIASLAWDAGSQRENWDLTDDDYGKRPIPPTKEQFLNSILQPKS